MLVIWLRISAIIQPHLHRAAVHADLPGIPEDAEVSPAGGEVRGGVLGYGGVHALIIGAKAALIHFLHCSLIHLRTTLLVRGGAKTNESMIQ